MTASAPARPGAMTRLLSSRPAVLAAAGMLMLVGLVPQFLSRTLPDIAFLLYAAERVIDGARLYVDLIEINPPLIVWLNVPIVLASRLVGVSEVLAYRVVMTLVLLASVASSRWVLLQCQVGRDPRSRRALLLAIMFALFLLPRLDWGEREHLTLALVLPYVLLAIARCEGRVVPRGPSLAIGAAAAIGIAIKPHFVLLWLAREALVAVRTRRLTLEGIIVPAAGIGYIALVASITPEYFGVARTLGPAYQIYLHDPLLKTAILGDGARLVLVALLVAFGLRRTRTHSNPRAVLIAAMLGCFVAAVLQQKGWRYHFYPALSLGWMLLALLAASLSRVSSWADRLFTGIAAAATATVVLAALTGALIQAAQPLHPRYDADPGIGHVLPFLREHSVGENVVVLSSNMASGFPLTTYAETRWPMRFSNLWLLAAEYDAEIRSPAPLRYRTPQAMTANERMLRRVVTEDFIRAEAPIVLVLKTGPDRPEWGMRRLDLLAFLRQDSRFAAVMDGYRLAGDVGQYQVYALRDRTVNLPRSAASSASDARAPARLRIDPARVVLGVVFVLLLAFALGLSGRSAL